MSRLQSIRRFGTGLRITTGLVGLSLCLGVALNGATGASVTPLSAFDDLMNGLLEKWQIPGAALGVSHHGRMVLARGYGLAYSKSRDPRRRPTRRGAEELVQPDSLFRIAGISKTLTAAAVLRLVEDRRLSLDENVSSILTGPGASADPRPGDGAVRDLLQTARDQPQIADRAYCILGRVIEKVSGRPYEDYVKSTVLSPLGITRMQLGHTTLAGRAPGEVRYYDYPGAPLIKSIIPKAAKAPRPYGAISVEALDSAGGWIASAPDLLRLVNAFDGRRPSTFLKQASLPAMMASLGVAGDDADWWIRGASDGVSAYVFRQASTGVDAVLLFNSRPGDSGAFDADLSAGVVRTINSVQSWPPIDLLATGPELFARDVVNAADYQGGGVAPGEIVVLFPSNAGPPEIAEWPAGPTGATRVFFDNLPAPIVYTVAGQVSAIVPHEISHKTTTEVVIEYQGVRSPPVTLPAVSSAPAFFTRDASGKGQAAMLNVTGCCNSARNPVMRGANAYLFATGEGLSLSPEDKKFTSEKPSPVPVPVPPSLKVTVGGVAADVLYAGDAGVLQVNIRVPENAPTGPAVPLVLMVGDSHSPDGVTIAVRSSTLRVLFVEHDEAIRSRLTEILEGDGYEVLTALDEVDAGARAREGPVDLLITDLAMPREGALKMIRAIQDENPELKIMVMSRDAGPSVLRDADILGAQAVLSQTATPEVLLRRVHAILQEHFVAF